MSGSDLTIDALKKAFAPMMLLPNAPTMTKELWLTLGNLLASENVTRAELSLAAERIVKTKDFWPAPAVILEHIRRDRQVALLKRRDDERKAALDHARQIAGPTRETGDTYRERERQKLKKRLGLGEYRSAAHKSRYGKEIEVEDPYLPPSLRKALEGGGPETEERRTGVRRLI